MPKVKEESWDLTSADIDAFGALNDTDGPYRWDGTASKWSDMWCYQVPTGTAHILKPSHHFSFYFDDASGECSAGYGRVKIVVRDQSQQDEKTIFGPALYESVKEFTDRDKMATLGLQSDLAIEERFWICIVVYSNEVPDESGSYFILETIRIRSTI